MAQGHTPKRPQHLRTTASLARALINASYWEKIWILSSNTLEQPVTGKENELLSTELTLCARYWVGYLAYCNLNSHNNPLSQWSSVVIICLPPRGHLVISGDIIAFHPWGDASIGQKPEMLLTSYNAQDSPHPNKTTWLQIPIVPR
jgi:hypothetical protein